MLSNDDHPGLFTFMVGVIVVVLVGVFLSLMVDRKFGFSRSANALENAIKADAEEILELKADVEERSRELAANEPKRRLAAASHESARRRLEADRQRLAALMETRDGLRKSIPAIAGEFAKYRAKYRDQTWAGAVGQRLGTLTVRGGREYREVVVTQVTGVGLEIRHADGIARLQAPDLDQPLQDRFQWNDEERRARLNEEHAAGESLTRLPVAGEPDEEARPVKPVSVANRVEINPDTAKIEALRAKVMAWKSKVSQLSSDLSQAKSSAYGSQSSVPGSLETWQAKSNRLSSEFARARAGLAAAKAALAAVSPNDFLLRPDPAGD